MDPADDPPPDLEEEDQGTVTLPSQSYFYAKIQKVERPERHSDRKLREVKQRVQEAENGNPVIKENVLPLVYGNNKELKALCSTFRGIQGHHNSCYMDATLFSMFAFTSVFDNLIYRPREENDITQYDEVQKVLREEIVHPLRRNKFVNAERVMKLRHYLNELSSVSGMTSEEKDPEEFLSLLFDQILRAKPFLKMNTGHETNCYQLFVEKDERLQIPTVQQLLEQSFFSGKIKLKEVPQCLILQMPRFGKRYKMYDRIIPSQLLDITDILETSPRQCTLCGELATHECAQCSNTSSTAMHDGALDNNVFCRKCVKIYHQHKLRADHEPYHLESGINHEDADNRSRQPRRINMHLFAVLCIETSHYVAFTKCGKDPEAPWCFFDSMADREGESDGINIPTIVECPDISKWLSNEQNCRTLPKNNPSDRHLPEHVRRLFCDGYICMYQSSDFINTNNN